VQIHMQAAVLRNNTASSAGGAVYVSGTTDLHASDCVFEGNTVFDNATQDVAGYGGALNVEGSGHVMLSNITLVNNRAGNGGAMYAELDPNSSEVVMRMHATVLRNNLAGIYGGGLHVSGATRLHAPDCVFEGNTVFDDANQVVAGSGGAVYVDGSAPVTLSNITLVNNQAYYGGGIFAALTNNVNLSSPEVVMHMHATIMRKNSGKRGGAVHVSGPTQLQAADCVLESNNATMPNSGSGGALYVDSSASATLVNIAILNNEATYGGAIYALQNSRVNLSNAFNVSGNQAVYSGGAVYLADFTALSLSHGVLLKNNFAGQAGGGIAAFSNSTLDLGPGVQVVNNTANNEGGGVYMDDTSILTVNSQAGATSRVLVTGNAAKQHGGGFCLLSEKFKWHSVRAAASLNTAPYGADCYVPTTHLQVVNGTTELSVTSRLDGRVQVTVNTSGAQGIPSAGDVHT
jgi:hypothetical protein